MPKNKTKEFVEGLWKDDDIYFGIIQMRDGTSYNGHMRQMVMKHGRGIIYDKQHQIKEMAEYEDDFLKEDYTHKTDWKKCTNCEHYGFSNEYCCMECQKNPKSHDQYCRSNTCGLTIKTSALTKPKDKCLFTDPGMKNDIMEFKKGN